MQWDVPEAALAELSAPVFQLAVTAGVGMLCAYLWRRFGKAHFGWWALAWGLYGLRLLAIVTFLATQRPIWLFWHQVTTGWTAVGFLVAALVFARRRGPAVPLVTLGLAFPLIWSWVAIYRLDHFLWAAAPAVAFLSGATLWTGAVFYRHHRRGSSRAALLLSGVFVLWAIHHLDYPFLRAQGIWNPWGYYVDVAFTLTTAVGLLLLVQEDLRRGLETLAALSGDLQGAGVTTDVLQVLLERPLALPGVVGTALFRPEEAGGHFVARSGEAGSWAERPTDAEFGRTVREAIADRRVRRHTDVRLAADSDGERFLTILPLPEDGQGDRVLVLAADASDPFLALGDRFLEAFAGQIGAALESADLYERLAERSGQLESLAVRMTRQHEEERLRLSRDLHDETAQVLAALHLELGALRESLADEAADGVDVALRLAGEGIRAIRNITAWLRPPLLDDLGLLPALRALIEDFRGTGRLQVKAELPDALPAASRESELALYRALQEGLANAARHSHADRVDVEVARSEDELVLSVSDTGTGMPRDADAGNGTGIAGLRERLHAVGGSIELRPSAHGGTEMVVRVPVVHDPVGAGGPT